MPSKNYKKILLAPLDWGMGHTTRMLPIVKELLAQGHQVFFAGNKAQIGFAAASVSGLAFLEIDGYNVSYGSHAALSTLLQVPAILKAIKYEHNWLLDQCRKQKFDGIISDNRYGLYHPCIPSVIVTHQLRIPTQAGWIADDILQRLHSRFIDRFRECWVPDLQGSNNLAGSLSNPQKLPKEVKYLGLLSQFVNSDLSESEQRDITGHLLIVLSGPEPQRSILSKKLWAQLKAAPAKQNVIFVEGTNNYIRQSNLSPGLQQFGRLDQQILLPLIQDAGMIICRSGYSTLMDLIALEKMAIIIPTPGQPEQEYLADRMKEKGIFYRHKQSSFQLASVQEYIRNFHFSATNYREAFTDFKPVLNIWVDNL